MYLKLELHDNNGKVGATRQAEPITLKELRDEINDIFHVPVKYQQLSVKENSNLVDIQENEADETVEDIGLLKGNTVIVKHFELETFEAYKERVKEAAEKPIQADKITAGIQALDCYKSLENSHFFLTYKNLYEAIKNRHHIVTALFDKTEKQMKEEAMAFFTAGRISFPPLEAGGEGSTAAILCEVISDTGLKRYRIKPHQGAGKSDTGSGRQELDLIELYLYKLLEVIGAGPEIVFIPNNLYSRRMLYIGSVWEPKFFKVNELKLEDISKPGFDDKWKRIIVQLHFLAVFLSLSDMSEENIGMNDGNAFMVDFLVNNYGDTYDRFFNPTFRSTLLFKHDSAVHTALKNLLEQCGPEERKMIAKESMKMWKFEDNLDLALKMMDKEKENFHRGSLDFAKGTKNLKDYVEKVKRNVQEMFKD